MKVALTVWEDRVSPVFDSAQTLLVVEIEKSEIVGRHYERFNPDLPQQLVQVLGGQGVGVLICGAVSEAPAHLIEASGIELVPFIAGSVEKVLAAYAEGRSLSGLFSMPGCGRNPHCRRRHRHAGVFQGESPGGISEKGSPGISGKGRCGQVGLGKMSPRGRKRVP